MATEQRFFMLLNEFVTKLGVRFPDNEGIKQAAGNIAMFNNSMGHSMLMSKWCEITSPVADAIKRKDAKVVGEALDKCDIAVIAGMKAGESVLMNPEVDQASKENIWKFLQILSQISRGPAPPTQGQAPAANNVMAPPSNVMAAPAGAPTPAAFPSGEQIAKGIKEGLPKIMDTFKEIMKTEDGQPNPVADLIKQMMNPNQSQPGVFNNLFANAMEQTPPSVMEEATTQSGLSAEEIIYRLKRLENLEKSRSARKKMRQSRTPNNTSSE